MEIQNLIDVVVGVLFNENDEVLIQQRGPTKLRPGMWEYPGGKIERMGPDGKIDPLAPNGVPESPEMALSRELREELGITINVATAYYLTSTVLELENTYCVKLFLVELRHDSMPPTPHEGQAIRWVDPEWAVKHQPMVPSCYTFQPAIRHARVVRHMRSLRQRSL